MTLPATLAKCTVIGRYVDLLGNPIRGSLVVTPQVILKDKVSNVIIMPVAMVETLDATGAFSVVLPCTNDTDVLPTPFIYKITENFSGGREFTIALPVSVADTTQNMADLLPAVTLTDSAAYVTLDQYQALVSRYTTAEGIRVIVVAAPTYVANALAYRNATLVAANNLGYTNPNALMLMGM